MTTKAELGLGALYHATLAQNADQIIKQGIKPLAWLTTTREEAYVIISDYKFDSKAEAGSIKVFKVNLPGNWELRKSVGDEYISNTTIPPKYLRLLI